MQKLHTHITAAWRAGAGIMERDGKQQEATDSVSMDRKFQRARSAAEASQAVCETSVVSHAISWRWHAQAMVPCLDGVNTVLEDVKRDLEGQGVPDEGPKQVVRHRQKLSQNILPDGPSQDGETKSSILAARGTSPFQWPDVSIKSVRRLPHGGYVERVWTERQAMHSGLPQTVAALQIRRCTVIVEPIVDRQSKAECEITNGLIGR
jgi:hypothetical protein